eukprot:6201427-Pleurochrysis_carterae.AAC.3
MSAATLPSACSHGSLGGQLLWYRYPYVTTSRGSRTVRTSEKGCGPLRLHTREAACQCERCVEPIFWSSGRSMISDASAGAHAATSASRSLPHRSYATMACCVLPKPVGGSVASAACGLKCRHGSSASRLPGSPPPQAAARRVGEEAVARGRAAERQGVAAIAACRAAATLNHALEHVEEPEGALRRASCRRSLSQRICGSVLAPLQTIAAALAARRARATDVAALDSAQHDRLNCRKHDACIEARFCACALVRMSVRKRAQECPLPRVRARLRTQAHAHVRKHVSALAKICARASTRPRS